MFSFRLCRHLSPSSAAAGVLLLLLVISIPSSVTCLKSPPLAGSVTGPEVGQRSLSRVTRGVIRRIDGDRPFTFTLWPPVSDEQAVEVRLFGLHLADISGVAVELQRVNGSKIQRRLQPVPTGGGDGGSLAPELRWSLCGSAGVETVRVRVLWRAEESGDHRRLRINCRVKSVDILLGDGDQWVVRPGRVEFRRLLWPADTPDGPAAVVIHSQERTDAVACLRSQCADDGDIDSLSSDDVTCQEFTNCATFDIDQDRPAFLYIRPGAAVSRQIGKQVQVRYGSAPVLSGCTREEPTTTTTITTAVVAVATPVGGNVTENRRSRPGVPGVEENIPETMGAQERGESEQQEAQGQLEEEGRQGSQGEQEGSRTDAAPAKRPVKVLVKTSVTVYRPRQTESTPEQRKNQSGQHTQQQPQQQGTQQTQTPGQQQQQEVGAGGANGEGLTSGGPGMIFYPSSALAFVLLALVTVVRSVF